MMKYYSSTNDQSGDNNLNLCTSSTHNGSDEEISLNTRQEIEKPKIDSANHLNDQNTRRGTFNENSESENNITNMNRKRQCKRTILVETSREQGIDDASQEPTSQNAKTDDSIVQDGWISGETVLLERKRPKLMKKPAGNLPVRDEEHGENSDEEEWSSTHGENDFLLEYMKQAVRENETDHEYLQLLKEVSHAFCFFCDMYRAF